MKTAVFDDRAKELAKPFQDKTKKKGQSFLVFCLGEGKDENYALAYTHIEKVVPLNHLTEVPGASSLFLGVTYHNAEVWPVIDTEVLLGFQLETMQPEYVLLVRDGAYRYAFAVRYVLGHQQLSLEKGMTQLSGRDEKAKPYISGIWKKDTCVLDDKAILRFMNQLNLASNA